VSLRTKTDSSHTFVSSVAYTVLLRTACPLARISRQNTETCDTFLRGMYFYDPEALDGTQAAIAPVYINSLSRMNSI
jgi:hypothetical protein